MAAELSSPLVPWTLPEPTALDLGSGPCPAPGYVGVDLCGEANGGFGFQASGNHSSGFGGETPEAPKAQSPEPSSPVLYCDLFAGTPWPFASGSVERLRAWHVIEHIPHERIVVGTTRVTRTVRSVDREPQVHRESIPAKQEAFFWFFDEAYRIARPGCRFELAWPHPQSDDADQDPTHCRRVPVSMLHYLSREGRRTLRVHHYPVACDWTVEPGSVVELAHDEKLAPFTLADGSVDFAAAKRAHGVFHEIVATLVKL